MGDADTSKKGDVGQIAGRLECVATSTAQVLYAMAHIESHFAEAETTKELTQKLFALAGALRGLKETLIESGEQGVWTIEHGECLRDSMKECERVLDIISLQVQKADQAFETSTELKSKGKMVRGLFFDDGQDWVGVLDTCFQLVNQTTSIARYTILARKKHFDNEEMPETRRLISAFEHVVLDSFRARENEPLASEQLHEYRLPPPPTPVSSANQYKSQPGANPLAVPSTQTEKFMPTGPTPTSTYNTATIVESIRAPASTLKGIPGPYQSTQLPRSKLPAPVKSVTDQTMLFGQPSIMKPLSNSSSLSGGPLASFAKHDQGNDNPFAPAPHLEGYILRPTVQTSNIASTLSYGVDALPLDEDTLQAHVRKLGADHSVLDALLDLQPQQSHLIQLRATQRQGTIVSIQYGRPVDLSTLMGPMQVKPIIFVISTTTVLPQNAIGALNHIPVVSNPMSTMGRGPFPGPVPTTGFGSNTGFGLDPNRHYDSPEAYSRRLKEQGEPCTYVEGTERKGAFAHYQTITTNKDWHGKDRSLEEIRLADYDAGRKGPTTQEASGITYPWDWMHDFFGNLRGVGESKSARPTEAKLSQTSCFPITRIPSTYPEPKKALFGSLFDPPSPGPSSTPPVNPAINPSRGPFSHVAPDLPPFVPAEVSQPVASGRGLFGSNNPVITNPIQKSCWGPPLESKGFCTVQHPHSIFCQVPPSSPQVRQWSLNGDDVTFPPTDPATIGPRVDAPLFTPASTSQNLASFDTFTGTPAIHPSGSSLFGGPARTPNNQPFGAHPTTQPPAGSLFGASTNNPSNPFTSPIRPDLFGTAPAPPQRTGGLFGTTRTTAATPSASQPGLENQAKSPPKSLPDALETYQMQLRQLGLGKREEGTQRAGQADGAGAGAEAGVSQNPRVDIDAWRCSCFDETEGGGGGERRG